MRRESTIVGVDLGGTKVHTARISNMQVADSCTSQVTADGPVQLIMDEVISAIEKVWNTECAAIGIGVPSVVDVQSGMVYDVQNIPSWSNVSVGDNLKQHFGVPVYVNNDANCFALGSLHFGEGRGYQSLLGITIGTGIAAGVVFDGKLYNGKNCGAGEIGMIPYLQHNYEYYCSGQFFEHTHGTTGKAVFDDARNGSEKALEIFSEFGTHLGSLMSTALFAYDPEIIVLGGSVSAALPYFNHSMRAVLDKFPYRPVISQLEIRLSTEPNIAVMGAAALCLNARRSIDEKITVS